MYLRRLHLLAGLFTLTALFVLGATGFAVTFQEGKPAPTNVRVLDYRPSGSLSDRQVADDLYEKLRLPLAREAPSWAIRRNEQHALTINYFSPSGTDTVTVLEAEGKIR